MRYKRFGNSGLRVSEVALGTGTFGTSLGSGADREQSKRLFDAFAEAGGNLFDCADAYQNGEAEQFLGDFIRSDRDHFAVATKYTTAMQTRSLLKTGNSRKALIHSLEQSLRRFGSDYVDILWVHFPDHVTPVEEIVRAMDDVVRAGKVRYIGFSDFPAWRIATAATLAALRGVTPVSGVQIEYSLAERSAERELIPMASAFGLAAMVWSPLGGGLLSGKYRRGQRGRRESGAGAGGVCNLSAEHESSVLDALEAAADELGATMAQVAIAWIRQKGEDAGATMIPIIGARRSDQLSDNLGALQLRLSQEQLEHLDHASAIPMGFPHDFVSSAGLLDTQSAGCWSNLDRPRAAVL
jgi:aryl-alcohol dehydrogenase-like predicted oxidoreductase